MIKLSALQTACLKFLTTPIFATDDIANNDVQSVNLFQPKVIANNQTVQNLIAQIKKVALGETETIAQLETYFNFITSDSFEKKLGLEEATLHPQQKDFLDTIYNLLGNLPSAPEIQLRELTPFELALQTFLSYIAQNNLAVVSTESFNRLQKALLGDTNAQKETLVHSLILPDNIVDETLITHFRNLEKVITAYNSFFCRADKNLSAARKAEEAEEKQDLTSIQTSYSAAYQAALQANEFGHPQAETLIETIRSSLYEFADSQLVQAVQALQTCEFSQASSLFRDAEILAKQAQEFNHPLSQALLARIQEAATPAQQKLANDTYAMAREKFEQARQYSRYQSNTFRLAGELATLAKQLGSIEAPKLESEMLNTELDKKFRTINQRIREWLLMDKNQLSIDDIESELNKLERQIKNSSISLEINSNLAKLIHSSFRIIEAKNCLINGNVDEAFQILEDIEKIGVENPNTGILKGLIEYTIQQQELDSSQKSRKEKAKPEDEPKTEEQPKKSRKVEVTEQEKEEVTTQPELCFNQGQDKPTAEKQSKPKSPLLQQTLPQETPSTSEPEPEPKPIPSPSPRIEATAAPGVEKKSVTLAIATFASPLSPSPAVDPIPCQKLVPSQPASSRSSWNYLGIGLLGVGFLALTGGVIASIVLTGGLAFLIGTSLLAIGFLCTGTGVMLIKDDLINRCTSNSKKDKEDKVVTKVTAPILSATEIKTKHFNHPANAYPRRPTHPETDTAPPLSAPRPRF